MDIFFEFYHFGNDFLYEPELAFHVISVAKTFPSGQMIVNKDFFDMICVMFEVFGAFKSSSFIRQKVLFSIEEKPQLTYSFFKVVNVEDLLRFLFLVDLTEE